MKALFTPAVAVLLMLQMSCASSPRPQAAAKHQLTDDATLAGAKMGPEQLATPEVAVMAMKEGVLVAWKPVNDADGYFVYRETKESKDLLGIGPKEAQGFIDRNPPEAAAKYSVQAFKLSAPSEKQETQALPGTSQQSGSNSLKHQRHSTRVSFPM